MTMPSGTGIASGESEVVAERDECLFAVVGCGSRSHRPVDPLVLAGPVEDSAGGGVAARVDVDDNGDGAVLEREGAPDGCSVLFGVEVPREAVVANDVTGVAVDGGAGKG